MNYPSMSAIGLGTYRGACDTSTDTLVADMIRTGLASGITHFDTAINYRCQRAERVLGSTLGAHFREQPAARSEIVICSKAGFVPWDSDEPSNRESHGHEAVVDRGLASRSDISPEGHCIAPKFIQWSVERTLENLNLKYVDVIYVHNPEAQRSIATDDETYRRLTCAFEVLEGFVQAGRLRAYGISTWNALRVDSDHPQHLSLQRVLKAAESVSDKHHFTFVQAPLNLLMPELVAKRTQNLTAGNGQASVLTPIAAINALGLNLVVSAPLAGGTLRSRAKSALDFVRSIPGVKSVLIGARNSEHVSLPCELLRAAPLTGREIFRLLESIGGDS